MAETRVAHARYMNDSQQRRPMFFGDHPPTGRIMGNEASDAAAESIS